MHGFLGTHLKKRLEAQNITAFTIPREILYDVSQLKRYLRHTAPSVIYHLASYGNMSYQTEARKIFTANVDTTFNLLEASLDIPYKAFVHVSSSSAGLPTQTMYASSKLAAESIVKGFVNTYDKNCFSVRPFSVYGEAEADFRFIPTVINCVLSGKTLVLDPYPMHDWIYAGDLVTGMLAAVSEAQLLKGKVIELGTGIQHSNAEVVAMIEEIAGMKVKVNNTESRLRVFDNTDWKAKVGLGSARPLKEGLRLVYEYYKRRFEETDYRN